MQTGNYNERPAQMKDVRQGFTEIYRGLSELAAKVKSGELKTDIKLNSLNASLLHMRRACQVLGVDVSSLNSKAVSATAEKKKPGKGVNPFRAGESEVKVSKVANGGLRSLLGKKPTIEPVVEDEDETEEEKELRLEAEAAEKQRLIDEAENAQQEKDALEAEKLKLKQEVKEVLDNLKTYTPDRVQQLSTIVLKSVAKNMKLKGHETMNDEQIIAAINGVVSKLKK